jgi:hypothetical protein
MRDMGMLLRSEAGRIGATILLAFALSIASPVIAQTSVEEPLPLEAVIDPNGRAVQLSWATANPPRVGNVAVNRRRLGESGPGSWQPLAPALGPVMRFTDDTIRPGTAFEYQVLRSARDIVDVGYWVAGTEVPAEETRGTALLVVDDTLAAPLAARLDRFAMDLVGDGWRVIRHNTPRGDDRDPVANLDRAWALRSWVQKQYFVDPFGRHALILIGHVPVVQSGRAAPDGHAPVAHATDLFYAEMDGKWQDNRAGILLPNQVPSDAIEMQVGRIDMANLSGGDGDREIRLLAAYFDKNHHWRQGLLGDLREAYGGTGYLQVERNALRNIVGPEAVTVGGHHDAGEAQPWLWGVDFGSADAARYPEFANKAIFTINFGSGKQRFNRRGNQISAMLAQPWYTIASGWGGRPAWVLHPMALGRSIGEVHMRTVNNGTVVGPYREVMDYFPTGQYLWRNSIWVNLMGDPTSHAFPTAPARKVIARATGAGVEVSWTASADLDVQGYRIFRAVDGSTNFVPLNKDALITGTTFIDPDPQPGDWYMLRALALKEVPAGSFYSYAQGVFVRVGEEPPRATDQTVTTTSYQPISLTPGPELQGVLYAFIEGPEAGQLHPAGGEWIYTPAPGFAGEVRLRVSVSDGFATDEGSLTVIVGE